MSSIDIVALLDVIEESYSLEELKTLFVYVDVEFNSLSGGENLTAKARNLILHMRRRQRLPDLVAAISSQMPHLDMTPFGGSAPAPKSIPKTPTAPAAVPAVSQKEYINFDIRIQHKRGDAYPVEASYTLKGGTAETNPIQQRFDLHDAEFQDLFTYLQELVAEPEDTKAFGFRLRELLFPSQVWSLFNTLRQEARHDGKGVRIRLRIDPPELSRLPWEYCYDRENRVFFAQDLNTPLVRYIPRSFTPDTLETISPLRILMVMAEPSNLPELNMEKEESQLRQILDEVQGQVHFEVLKNATPDTLQRRLVTLQPHVLHFIGHGEFKDGEGALLLENDEGLAQRLNAEQLANLLRRRGVKLVVLNACETAASAEGDAFMGVAPSLVLADIPAVIAMQFAVPDTTAIRFSRALYDFLTLGQPLDTAVTEMRINASNGPEPEDQVFWAIPVLFMRSPDGVIWKTNRPPVTKTPAAENRTAATPIAETPDPAPPTTKIEQSNTGNGGINFGAGGNVNVNVGGDMVSGDKQTTITHNTTNIVGGEISLTELVEEIANDIKPHLPQMYDIDAEDLQDYIQDAQKLIKRDRYNRAAKKLEDAADLIDELDDDALVHKIQQAIALAEAKA